jgi:hypothetical protein
MVYNVTGLKFNGLGNCDKNNMKDLYLYNKRGLCTYNMMHMMQLMYSTCAYVHI